MACKFLVLVSKYKDPFNEEEYVEDCVFLPDINNEGENKNATYKENFISLNKLALVKFTEDTMVQPIDSEVLYSMVQSYLIVVWIL